MTSSIFYLMKKRTLWCCAVVSIAIVSCGSLNSKEHTATNTAQVSDAIKELLPPFNQISRL